MFRRNNRTARVSLAGKGQVVETDVEPSLTVGQLLEQMGCSDDKHVVESSVRGKNHKPYELVADIIPANGELSVSPFFDAGN